MVGSMTGLFVWQRIITARVAVLQRHLKFRLKSRLTNKQILPGKIVLVPLLERLIPSPRLTSISWKHSISLSWRVLFVARICVLVDSRLNVQNPSSFWYRVSFSVTTTIPLIVCLGWAWSIGDNSIDIYPIQTFWPWWTTYTHRLL